MTSSRVLLALTVLATAAAPARQTPPSQDAARMDSQAYLQSLYSPPPALRPADAQRIRDLVAQMTPKEKVGQMTQLELAMVTDGKDAAIRLNPQKLQRAVIEYGVGSMLNVNETALSVETWRTIIKGIQDAAAQTRLKVPVLYGIDTIHGANYVKGATIFPQPLGMAATWNPDLVRRGSRVAAAETRTAALPWTFSPVLDIGRQPLWPRLYETYGEDVHLASVMGAATIKGYQEADLTSPQQVAACLKHYVGYSFPTSGHDRTPALIPEITMREYFLPTFAAGVKAGALSVMVNSGEVNGIAGHVNKWLLTDVLRGEMHFDGVVVSDWEDIKKLVTIHHVAGTEKDATRAAILAGIDMSMVPSAYSFSDALLELVNEGAVPMTRIDEAVTRILTMKARLGLFDDPMRGSASPSAVGTPEARKVALEAARESIVLLRNKNALPLPAGSRVLVTGPTADSRPALSNGWTITWQGNRDAEYPQDRPTIRGALEARLGASRVTYVPGAAFDKELDIPAAVTAAKQADVTILCLGEMSYTETPGNIDDLMLPAAQLHLAREVAAAGKPVILILVEGRPRVIHPIVDAPAAILLALNPGMEGGTALTDVLVGEVNPSGRLPITYPRWPNALLTYDHKAFEEQDQSFGLSAFQPEFQFGSGMSYTTFEYSGLQVDPASAAIGSPVTISVTVKNTGSRAGAETVQLYIGDQVASVTPPVKRLRRFLKVPLEPGASREVRFQLAREDFSFIGADGRPLVEPGAFTVQVAGLHQTLTLR